MITDEEFKLLNDFIAQKCGIYYHEKQKYIFQQKLVKRLEKNCLKDFKEYYYLLKYNPSLEELQQLYNNLTVNETYFFREKEHPIALRDLIIPEMIKSRPNRVIKILSAGCSTGEEAYSLSILLHNKLKNPEKNIKIIGIDISQKAVEIALSAIYRKISLTFRSTTPDDIKKYFNSETETHNLKDNIKSFVKFKQGNLFEEKTFDIVDKYDVIFCRNVMIYFSKAHKQQLIDTFYKVLNPQGYLIVSHTENLSDVKSNFSVIKKDNCFMYQKN
ncbi:MAG: protein-glutamate O-methyltransferase CheR [Candidatus Sericytochromatia bacterium]|nr:protein-glutamate O-methyltransferase CheR [Candidatus Sericytochromatia bacterium]